MFDTSASDTSRVSRSTALSMSSTSIVQLRCGMTLSSIFSPAQHAVQVLRRLIVQIVDHDVAALTRVHARYDEVLGVGRAADERNFARSGVDELGEELLRLRLLPAGEARPSLSGSLAHDTPRTFLRSLDRVDAERDDSRPRSARPGVASREKSARTLLKSGWPPPVAMADWASTWRARRPRSRRRPVALKNCLRLRFMKFLLVCRTTRRWSRQMKGS